MSTFRNPERQKRVKLKLATRQGFLAWVPISRLQARILIKDPTWVASYCWYCHTNFLLSKLTIEHKVNKRDGGTNKQENLCLACPKCNLVRNKREQAKTNYARRTPWQKITTTSVLSRRKTLPPKNG